MKNMHKINNKIQIKVWIKLIIHICDIKGEEDSTTEKSGLSCINLKVNNKIKSHNQITRRRSFSCIGLSKGIRKKRNYICMKINLTNIFCFSSPLTKTLLPRVCF